MRHCFESRNSGISFIYELTRGKGRTIEIAVLKDGRIKVRVPYRMPGYAVESFLEEKSEWIRKHMEQIREEKEQYTERKFREGEVYFYLGKPYNLRFAGKTKDTVWLCGNEIFMDENVSGEKRRRDELEKWYRKQAKKRIPDRTRCYAEITGESPNRIIVKNQKKRWGSCSSLKNLNFNWKLIMLPQEIIDYVIIHELCHLKEMNHSKRFWQHVEEIMPDYRERRKWLKDNAWKVEWKQI